MKTTGMDTPTEGDSLNYDLYDYQLEDLERLKHEDNIFVAWEMSLGKTLFTVAWVNEKKKQDPSIKTVVVVLPLNTRRSWEREIKTVFPGENVYRLESSPKNVGNFAKLKDGKPGWYLVGWELMRQGVLLGENMDVAIADETHKQANFGKSEQSRQMQAIQPKYKAALSGTPAANTPDGIFGTQWWLWSATHPHLYRSRQRWLDHYWRQKRNGATVDLIREIDPGAIVRDMPAFTRRLTKDHRADMPPVLPEIQVDVELSPRQRQLYDKLDESAAVWLDEENFLPTAYPLEQDIRLRQIALGVPTMVKNEKTLLTDVTFAPNAKSSKIDALVEIISDQPEEETFLVLVHSAKFIATVVHQLEKKGIKAYGFSGETKIDRREWLLDNLGTEYRVLVAGIAAIGEGVDGLQHKCHNMVWLSKHPNAYLNKQAAFRLNRPGQQHPINSWYIMATGTVDVSGAERLKDIEYRLDEMIDNHTEV